MSSRLRGPSCPIGGDRERITRAGKDDHRCDTGNHSLEGPEEENGKDGTSAARNSVFGSVANVASV